MERKITAISIWVVFLPENTTSLSARLLFYAKCLVFLLNSSGAGAGFYVRGVCSCRI